MLHKCANPGCAQRFHYWHDGRLMVVRHGDPRGNPRRMEYFWFCGNCAPRYEMVRMEDGRMAVKPALHPRPAQPAARASQERLLLHA